MQLTALTKNQSLAVLGASGCSLLVSAVAGHIVVKKHDEMVKNYNAMREVGIKLGRIATFQHKILDERAVDIDGFDRMAFYTMTQDLEECIERLRNVNEEDKKS